MYYNNKLAATLKDVYPNIGLDIKTFVGNRKPKNGMWEGERSIGEEHRRGA
jgi:hypothetical protein